VSFGTQFPPNPCRGHFLWDGQALWVWDGVAWQRIGPEAPGTAGIPEAPIDGNLYGRENAGWMKIAPPTTLPRFITNFYSASQAITIPAGIAVGLVVMWGATGGSGGSSNNGTSGGTGAGGYLQKYLTGLTGGLTLTYTQGMGGTAGAAGGAGGNATPTTLSSGTQTIGTLTCNGSNGSAGVTNAESSGTLGGSASGGDLNVTGQSGVSPGGLGSGTGPMINPGGLTGGSRGADGIGNVIAAGNPGNPGGLMITWG
jgi:hypothetical protein